MSASPRTSLAIDLNGPYPSSLSPALSSLVKGVVVRGPVAPSRKVLRRPRNISLIPSGVRLSNVRMTLIGTVDQRAVLQRCLSAIGRGCSCVLLSYVPSLNVLAIGTLTTTSGILVPIRTTCLPTGNLRRLLKAVGGIGERVGPGLEVRKVLLAVISDHAGCSGSVDGLVQRDCNKGLGICGASVPHSIHTRRVDTRKADVFGRSPGNGITRTCGVLAGRILGGTRGEHGRRLRKMQ